MRNRTAVVVIAAAALVAGLVAPVAAAPPSHVDVIVVLEAGEDARGVANETARNNRAEVSHVYEHALTGFAARVPEGRLNGLRNDPRVDYVELDGVVATAAQEVPTGVERAFATDNDDIPITGTSTGGGAVDADVAVLDTGIDPSHPDLDVVASTQCMSHTGGPPQRREYVCQDGSGDDNGHGTHVAGTIAAKDNDLGVVGVAPGARLWSVQVLDHRGSGSWSTVIAGIDHVTEHADQIDVANMSLSGSGSSQALDDALAASVAAGVVYTLAAGNASSDVSTRSPAGHPDALTVAALADYDGLPGGLASPTCGDAGPDDTFATFSNFGDGVDLVAPGVCITSTATGGGTSSNSGTSMAAPHVAGAAALLASAGDGTPAQIHSTILDAANTDWVTTTSPDGTAYPLLDVGDETVFSPALVGDEPDDPDEDLPPEVSIVSHDHLQEVSGTVEITAEATDDDEVVTVEFNLDGTKETWLEGQPTSSAEHWSTTWDTTGHEDGQHRVTARATDSSGQTDEHAITLEVVNDGAGEPDPPEEPADLEVEDLDGRAEPEPRGPHWRAFVTTSVVDGDGDAAGVEVVLDYVTSRGDTGTLACTTGGDGTCEVDEQIHHQASTATFTVVSLDGQGVDGSQITLAKP